MSAHPPFEPLGLPPGPNTPVETPAPPLAEQSATDPAFPPSPPQPSPPQAAPPREPFWGYSDVALFIGLLLASALVSLGIVSVLFSLLPVRYQSSVAEALLAQSLIYLLAFSALALLFRIHYDKPFWRSLGWIKFPLPAGLVVVSGASTAIVVAFLGALIRTPTTTNRITEMLENPKSLVWVAMFGLTLAPLAEELVFRGFLQPLLVRSLGPAPGIIATAIPFGLLHFSEYGNSWRHALLISLAGAAFGWMRYRTGSVQASALMHTSYNGLEFIAYILQQRT